MSLSADIHRFDLFVSILATPLLAQPDPRTGLDAGFLDAEIATLGLEHTANVPKPAGFFDPANPGSFAFVSSDIAFSGDIVFIGSFNGLIAYDISDPDDPTLIGAVICPGGQGDLSVFGNLLFMSVEESRARVDCGTDPTVGTRFQGVRIFDISDVSNPGADRGGPDLPRLAPSHARHRSPATRTTFTSTTRARPASDRRARSPAATTTPPPARTRRAGASTSSRFRWRRRRRGDRQPAADLRRPRDRRARRAAECASDAHASVRYALGADSDHRRLLRHRGLPRARARRRRLRGQRDPARHQRSGEPGPARCRRRSQLSRIGSGSRSPTTGRRSSSPTNGVAARLPAAGRPTSRSGERPLSTTSSATS